MAEKAAVAMSGGVDSSSAALLLKEQGYDCFGLTLLLNDKNKVEDIADAKSVCDKLGIEHYIVDVMEEFEEKVVRYFIDSYKNAFTPNPCMRCNVTIKFGLMLAKAFELGAAYLATGHYANVKEIDGRVHLYKSRDANKDQGYFLAMLTQKQLSRALFPLAQSCKDENRQLLKDRGINFHEKGESQDACFIGEGGYTAFLKERVPDIFVPGEILHENGTVLGKHEGVVNYTIGQRKGLGVAYSEALYVSGLDAQNNRVIVSDKDGVRSKAFLARDMNVINGLDLPWTGEVKTRYRSETSPVRLSMREDGLLLAEYLEEGRTAAPGQFAVFYDGDEILGGAEIVKAL